MISQEMLQMTIRGTEKDQCPRNQSEIAPVPNESFKTVGQIFAEYPLLRSLSFL